MSKRHRMAALRLAGMLWAALPATRAAESALPLAREGATDYVEEPAAPNMPTATLEPFNRERPASAARGTSVRLHAVVRIPVCFHHEGHEEHEGVRERSA